MSHEASTYAWSLDLSPGAKLVLLAVADHADKTGFCWPGAEGLADKCKVSERTVWRQIGELEKSGILCRTRRSSQSGRRSNSYQIHLTPECQFCNVTKEVPQHDTSGVSNMTPASGCINKEKESSREPSLEPLDIWPDWYSDLYAIKGFKKTLEECTAWLIENKFGSDRANETASAVKAKWPINPKNPHTDPWATFRNWVKRPLLGESNGKQRASSVEHPTEPPEPGSIANWQAKHDAQSRARNQ